MLAFLRLLFLERTYEVTDVLTVTMCETNDHPLAGAWWINKYLLSIWIFCSLAAEKLGKQMGEEQEYKLVTRTMKTQIGWALVLHF